MSEKTPTRQKIEITTEGCRGVIKIDGVELQQPVVGYTLEHKAGEPPILKVTTMYVPRSLDVNGVAVDVTTIADAAKRVRIGGGAGRISAGLEP